ncbi:hypothetical protein CSKR_108289 [Clonorchis sinensis]|uniref:Uncharacterized protein n=1 Tax=Clonorchis sinensis TaxID=79923 RepID=A0A3R7CFU8_CLOSI|nr:hypothetical protein CSKR_108289 [Clonorchis sinensis]
MDWRLIMEHLEPLQKTIPVNSCKRYHPTLGHEWRKLQGTKTGKEIYPPHEGAGGAEINGEEPVGQTFYKKSYNRNKKWVKEEDLGTALNKHLSYLHHQRSSIQSGQKLKVRNPMKSVRFRQTSTRKVAIVVVVVGSLDERSPGRLLRREKFDRWTSAVKIKIGQLILHMVQESAMKIYLKWLLM